MTVLSVTCSPAEGVMTLGEHVAWDYFTLTPTFGSAHYESTVTFTGLPDGVTYDPMSAEMQGAPVSAGSGTATFTVKDNAGHTGTAEWPWTVIGPLEAPTGLAATPTDTTLEVTWAPSPGATGYTLEHRQAGTTEWTPTPTTSPSATLEGLTPGTAYDLRVSASDDTTTTSPSGTVTVFTTTSSNPEPDPNAMPADLAATVASLAPALAAYLGRAGNADAVALATAQLPIVVEFVRGYTRSSGWTGYTPPYPLRSVIVSAAARLVTNPEQVESYSMADYSERPAVLNGYTLAELGVLRRYRRVQA